VNRVAFVETFDRLGLLELDHAVSREEKANLEVDPQRLTVFN